MKKKQQLKHNDELCNVVLIQIKSRKIKKSINQTKKEIMTKWIDLPGLC